MKAVDRAVFGARHEDVEDACAFAWIQFFRYQTWRLNAMRRSEWTIATSPGEVWHDAAEPELADPSDPIEQRFEFMAAMHELKQLPTARSRPSSFVRRWAARPTSRRSSGSTPA